MIDIQLHLREAGVYATPQRLAIAEFLFARHQHLTADQVFTQVNKETETVSRATVYNTLSLFSEKGLIKEIRVDASRTFYDSNTRHHFHFYDVDSKQLSDMEDHIADQLLADDLPECVPMEGIEVVVRINGNSYPPQ